MRWKDIVDYKELKKTIETFKPFGQLFEVRIFGTVKGKAISGYFTDYETLARQLDTIDLRGKSIYFTLQALNPAVYARDQHDKFIAGAPTTADTDVLRYEWFFVDLDPIRPTGVSSTDTELKAAEDLMEVVRAYLARMGFEEPVVALSGNGYHLLYRIDLPADDEHRDLVSDCLTALSELFNNGKVKIDTVNCNPARIAKLAGTLAQKGFSTEDRPHRMSRILSTPDDIRVTGEDVLRALAAELPKPAEKPVRVQKHAQAFDIRAWLADHHFSYKEDIGRDCQIFLLDECPFDPSHKNGDSKIFAYTNGAIAFKCHHNSCRGKKWQDVREKYEPDAYAHKEAEARIEEGYRLHRQLKSQPVEDIPLEGDAQPAEKPREKKLRKLRTADALMQKDLPELRVLIGVGEELPLLVEGTCILSAKPKLGKSWLALAMCLALASGEDFLGRKTEKCSTLYLDLETSEVIQKKRLTKALHGRPVPKNFYLETETDSLGNGFVEQIEAYLAEDPNIGLVVIDVFQIIRSGTKNFKETEYEHAYRDITPLNELAQRHHISIILVCHDRKAVEPDDPFANILGSTGLQGAATQMIVMYRKKKDDPIHISVKGKTIDGLPDLDVALEDAEWKVVEGGSAEDREKAADEAAYKASRIREAVVAIMEHNTMWKGRCSSLIQDAIDYDIAITDSPKAVGAFLHRHIGRFLEIDGIKITMISNGTGPKIYKLSKFTIDTIDGSENIPLMDWQDASVYGASEVPFS